MYDIGFIGLGKMGSRLARLAGRKGFKVTGFDRNRTKTELEDLDVFDSLQELVNSLQSPRILWVMVPAGIIVDEVLLELRELLDPKDIVIDAGNSNYKDSIRHAEELSLGKIDFLDCGTSGGLKGAENGACLMVGGDPKVFEQVEPIFESLSIPNGLLHCGPAGAGHFVKMIHNGIEYGMMQAIGEGFELLEKSPYSLESVKISSLWNHGSVIRGWLMELISNAFGNDRTLDSFAGPIGYSGEGQWTVDVAKELGIDIPVIQSSVDFRRRSNEETSSIAAKVVSALRYEFGGHTNLKQSLDH